MGDSFRGMLPPVYQPLFEPFFDKDKVKETRAECEKCSMCNHGEPAPVPMEYFRSDTKCCTYWPQLPNYLVGAILADPSPEQEEGKKRLRKIIASRKAVTPYWVSRPGRWQLLLSAYGNAFGRAGSLRCPFFDQEHPEASCTIWRHRETICMTYYCKYNGGQRGYDFWVAFKDYLAQVQASTVRFATDAIDTSLINPQLNLKDLTVEEIDDEPPKDSDYARWWGKWVGHEEEFYIKCYEWLASVPREQFMMNVDSIESVKAALDKLKSAHEVLEAKLIPTSLVRNARMREQHVNDKVVVTTYHRYDSFSLDKDLYDVVGLFRGDQSLTENLERLKKDGVELAPDLIEFLFAAGVLVTPPKKVTSDPEDPKALEARRVSLDAIIQARNIKLDESQLAKLAEPMNAASLDALVIRAATAKSAADLFVQEEPKK
jgi:Fe-S-cluster containining protein